MRMKRGLVWGLALVVSACSAGATVKEPAGGAGAPGRPAGSTATPTLDGVRSRGFVRCGVTTGVAGFSAVDKQGTWTGLDVDVCRAIAAAVLGDASKVRYTPLTAAQRFTALQTGEIDVLSRITTITFQRDAQLGIEFPAIDWYDGTALMVRRSLNVKSVKDLDGATICMQPGTTQELDVADYFRRNHMKFTPVVIERIEESTGAFYSGRCDAFAQDQASLASVRVHSPKPDDYVVLPEVISKAPFGPGVMPNDTRWIKIVRWSVYAMMDAEELGLASTNIDAALSSDDPNVQRFVGKTGDFGAMLGVDGRWAYNIVRQVGNYGESVERNLLPLGIARGQNRLWKDGGLVYAPPLQ